MRASALGDPARPGFPETGPHKPMQEQYAKGHRMIEEITTNLYRIEVPLPRNPLRTINSYVIKGKERNLVVDTGMNREECEKALASGFSELDLDLDVTDFFITHFHADHIGLVTRFAQETSLVYYNETEAAFIGNTSKSGNFQTRMTAAARLNGFPEDEVKQSAENHPGFKFSPPVYPEFTIVRDGDTLNVGDFTLECVSTPGHTVGHMCLYERDRKFFLAGDHILGDITPNIAHEGEAGNPLGDFLHNLDKVDVLDVELVLPGHRTIFTTFHERIAELKHHHAMRVNEVLDILSDGSMTVYEIAGRMTWNIKAKSWADFPVMQKWFASGECNAHLIYLEQKGKVQRDTATGVALLSLT